MRGKTARASALPMWLTRGFNEAPAECGGKQAAALASPVSAVMLQ